MRTPRSPQLRAVAADMKLEKPQRERTNAPQEEGARGGGAVGGRPVRPTVRGRFDNLWAVGEGNTQDDLSDGRWHPPFDHQLAGGSQVKAREWDRVILTVDVPSGFRDVIIPEGTTGGVIEAYEQPTECYAVDVNIPDESSLSGFQYDNVILYPDQFDLVPTDSP